MSFKIVYTQVDEAPELASSAWLPIMRAMLATAQIDVETRDISLAARILAAFPENSSSPMSDDLAWLGQWVMQPEANVIKLPNISASLPQLKAAIKELQQKGYALPDYPDKPESEQDKKIAKRYDSIKGSAVNPVLRQGNSDRRVAPPVKAYAKQHPHSMAPWSPQSRTQVAHMDQDDFMGSEQSFAVSKEQQGAASIEFIDTHQQVTVLKSNLSLHIGDVVDSSALSIQELTRFIKESIKKAQDTGCLLSLHLKATMMKVSDPVIFGQVIRVYFQEVFQEHGEVLADLCVNPDEGLAELLKKIETLPEAQCKKIQDAINKIGAISAPLAMVDSDHGITNLHVSSDVIVDASMAALIRNGGQMWDHQGQLQDTVAMIPDRSYAKMYQTVIDFCKLNGAFDPSTMGSVANVGLMGQKAEEYGSHDKTFIAQEAGFIRVRDAAGQVSLTQKVAAGDIFRCCITRAAPIADWIQLAFRRAELSNTPVVFWLNEERAHDRLLIKRLDEALKRVDKSVVQAYCMSPTQAMQWTLERSKAGQDTLAATGNVLRDYLTDLFPILELGTSAKMLSIVPLAQGGGLFETGAGGSAPKHVQQFLATGHLRWDSLGEYLALVESLSHGARHHQNAQAQVLADTLSKAITCWLTKNEGPGRRLGETTNTQSHFYLWCHWVEALSQQQQSTSLQKHFAPIAQQIEEAHKSIAQSLQAPGQPVDCGGYYLTDSECVAQVTRSSAALNDLITRL